MSIWEKMLKMIRLLVIRDWCRMLERDHFLHLQKFLDNEHDGMETYINAVNIYLSLPDSQIMNLGGFVILLLSLPLRVFWLIPPLHVLILTIEMMTEPGKQDVKDKLTVLTSLPLIVKLNSKN